MENAMSNVKKKVSKLRTLNENVPPFQIVLDDTRGRYLQSKTMSPGFQPYAENMDFGSPPLARYFYADSPLSGKSNDSFDSPIFGASKYRSTKLQQYSGGGTSSGNSSFGSRARLSLSPLSSIENFVRKSPPMYRTPVKGDDEVLVMDDIQVRLRPMSGGKSGRSSSSSSSGRGSSSSSSSLSSTKSLFKTDICRAWEDSGNCRYNSKCQFAHGRKELHPGRLSMKRKSEGQMGREYARPGSWTYSPNSPAVHKTAEVAEAEHAVRRLPISQPTSPEPHCSPANSNTISDWSPLDDGIEVVLPNGSGRDPSREEVEAHIMGTLNQRTTKRRLPVFYAICKGQ